MKIISETIKITLDELPPKTVLIEEEIKKQGLEPIRWAIVETEGNTLTLNVSGYKT